MNTTHIDWSQLWNPGPRRIFTADEMAQAGGDRPSPTLLAMALIHFGLLTFGVLQLTPPSYAAQMTAALVALAAAGGWAARWLWARPWRQSLMKVSIAIGAGMLLLTAGIRWREPDAALPVIGGALSAFLLLWGVLVALVIWRSYQIEGRLREQAERERSIEMARRLAASQIEPHFLFNTLASVQHWVQTGDARAAPLLASLTGYLRTTLPLFQRQTLVAADELLALQRYLEVMQARMGDRLRWHIDVDADAGAALLPPGLLLTLVENAVVHGLEPQVAGGRIDVKGRLRTGDVEFSVTDDGVGLPPDCRDGIGLTNIRERLQLAYGDRAGLRLSSRPSGGCRAVLLVPMSKQSPS